MFDRNTIISSTVLTILKNASQPMPVKDIIAQLNEESITANKTTIYRIINKLKQKKEISELTINKGATYYELRCDKQAHLICNKCDSIRCLDLKEIMPLVKLQQAAMSKQFEINSHELNVYGTCELCGKK